MPKMTVEHADFTTIENSIESIIDSLPEGLSLLEKMPIFYGRFRLKQTDLAHNPKDPQRRRPSRDWLRRIENGEEEPGKNALQKLEYSARQALQLTRGATAVQAVRVAAWLARGSPLNKRATVRTLNEKAPKVAEPKPEELPKPLQADSSSSKTIAPSTLGLRRWINHLKIVNQALKEVAGGDVDALPGATASFRPSRERAIMALLTFGFCTQAKELRSLTERIIMADKSPKPALAALAREIQILNDLDGLTFELVALSVREATL